MAPIPFPEVAMTASWTLPALLGYLGTWSGVVRYRADRGSDPVAERLPAFEAAWGDVAERTVTWPLAIRTGRSVLAIRLAFRLD